MSPWLQFSTAESVMPIYMHNAYLKWIWSMIIIHNYYDIQRHPK